jgi:cell division septation protein DedD
MNRKVLILICALLSAIFAYGDTAWEGIAARSRLGEFPSSGYYGASNTFPPNSVVTVTNLNNGQSAQLIIAKKLADPSLFLLVSDEATEYLSIPASDSAMVRVAPVIIPPAVAINSHDESPFSMDPDINPAAVAGNPNDPELLNELKELTELTASEGVPPVEEDEPVVEEPDIVEPVEETFAEVETSAEEADPVDESQPEAALIEEIPDIPDTNFLPVLLETPDENGDFESPAIPESSLLFMEDLGEELPYVEAVSESEMLLETDVPVIEEVETIVPETLPDEPDIPQETFAQYVPEDIPEADSSITLGAAVPVPPQEMILEKLEPVAAVIDEPGDSIEILPVMSAYNPLTNLLEQVQNRSPQKQLFLPPREDELFTFVEPPPIKTIEPDISPVLIAEAVPEEPEETVSEEIETVEAEAADLETEEYVEGPEASLEEERETDMSLDEEEYLPMEPEFIVEIAGVDEIEDNITDAEAGEESPVADVIVLGPEIPEHPPVKDGAVPEIPVPETTAEISIPADAELTLEPTELKPPTYDKTIGEESIESTLALVTAEGADIIFEPNIEVPTLKEDYLNGGRKEPTLAEGQIEILGEEPVVPAVAVAESVPLEGLSEELPEVIVIETVEEIVPELIEVETEIAQAPEKLPVEEPESKNTGDQDWAFENLPIVASLASESFYLQVGAFSNPRSAKSTLSNLESGYPVAVLRTTPDERDVYKVFVGPLNEDEKGTILYWFKAQGYKDAFIRRGSQ